MSNSTTQATEQKPEISAKRALEKFDDLFHNIMLALRARLNIAAHDNPAGEDRTKWEALYYTQFSLAIGNATISSRFNALQKQFAATANAETLVQIETLRDEAIRLLDAARAERDAERAAKAARIAARAGKAKNVTKHGVQLGTVTMAAFESLAALLEPIRVQYAERAEEMAKATVEHYRKTFEKAGWNMEAAFPQTRNSYARQTAFVLTMPKPGTRRDLVCMDADKIRRFIGQRRKDAQAVVDAFVVKLSGKIGKPITGGTCTGSLWDNSTLRVTLADDSAQEWHTHCIFNQSCLGKIFNQWPTRRAA